MLKKFCFVFLALYLVSCAGKTTAPVMPEDRLAPGMIPKECEDLLMHSKNWGFTPDAKWAPKNTEMAKEAMTFFSIFHLLPMKSSNYAQYWDQMSNPQNNQEAQKRLDDLSKAQSCDVNLTYSLMSGLINYRWPIVEHAFVREQVLKFLFNQQASFGSLMVRAVTISLLEESIKKGYVRGNQKMVKNLQENLNTKKEELKKDIKNEATAMIIYQSAKKEIQYSENFRSKIAEILPLP